MTPTSEPDPADVNGCQTPNNLDPCEERKPLNPGATLDRPPYTWGNWLWHFSAPPLKRGEENEPADYNGVARLTRLHGSQPEMAEEMPPKEWFMDGDSDYAIGNLPQLQKTFGDQSSVFVTPVINDAGRLAAFSFKMKGVRSEIDAYHCILSSINHISLRIAAIHEVPLRIAAIWFCRMDRPKPVALLKSAFPVQPIVFPPELPGLMERLYARYVDANRSNSALLIHRFL